MLICFQSAHELSVYYFSFTFQLERKTPVLIGCTSKVACFVLICLESLFYQ